MGYICKKSQKTSINNNSTALPLGASYYKLYAGGTSWEMFLERASCVTSPKGHGLPSDCLYDIMRELVLHDADLEAKCRIMKTPKAAASCE